MSQLSHGGGGQFKFGKIPKFSRFFFFDGFPNKYYITSIIQRVSYNNYHKKSIMKLVTYILTHI